jgi:hypothetical protein
MRNSPYIKYLLALFVYLGVYYLFDNLNFEIRKDEEHFWPTSLLFSKSFLPSISLLQSYNELNTPLPFYVFGLFEKLFSLGIWGGRMLNFSLSYLIVSFILSGKKEPYINAICLLIFPYYIATSTHLYTDIIASFFTLIGIICYLKYKYKIASLCFILSIASRQYMLAFVVGSLIFSLLKKEHRKWKSFIPLLVSFLSIFIWYILFGGFAPPTAIDVQSLTTSNIFKIFPDHALYYSSCVGFYYVLPELIIERKANIIFHRNKFEYFYLFAIVCIAFILFPPIKNLNYGIETMGYFDKGCRVFDSDLIRIIIFTIFSYLALLRFFSLSLPSLLFFSNFILMFKSHIGWDKYVLALIIILWYFRSCISNKALNTDVKTDAS